MLVLITYDVSTQSAEGKTRLRKVAKECVNYGQRVQNSVFECILDASQLLLLKDRLVSLISEKEDSLRFYYLGNNYQTKVEHFGKKTSYMAEGVLMLLVRMISGHEFLRGFAPKKVRNKVKHVFTNKMIIPKMLILYNYRNFY